MTATSSILEALPASDSPRGAVRGVHQAIIVVDRRLARQADARANDTPAGWRWVLGNAKIGDLYDCLFAECQLTWSSLVVPQEQEATFAALAPRAASQQGIVAYSGQLQLKRESLASTPEDSERLFLIFNGQRFPICDIEHALAVHRQNRCDATLIDFPRQRRRGYDERLRIDDAGRVQRVDRSYEGDRGGSSDRDWPSIIILSAPAMNQLLNVELPQRISQWPSAMLRAGLRLRGSTIPGRGFDLHDRAHLYELNEVLLRLKPEWLCSAGRLVDQGQRIWVGRNVRIASSAQLIGPIAIGDDVEIGPDAVIVGPTSIGRGCKIGSGIILKRCVVLPETSLASTGRAPLLSHAVVLGSDALDHAGAARATPTIETIGSAPAADVDALEIDRPIRLETVLEVASGPALGGYRYRAFCMAKRASDIILSVCFLACTLPFYPLIALAIRLSSRGPIFYAHVRQGRGGRNFRCWKFRTMVPDADAIKARLIARNEVDGPQFKMKDDPRTFAVGRVLRRLNVDEWPQFYNVLVGDMSIVGPRPSPDRENQMCPAWREARLSVRPGITGLWQVMRKRHRGETDFQEWIYYDVQYVKKQSFWLDAKILLKTIRVIFAGR